MKKYFYVSKNLAYFSSISCASRWIGLLDVTVHGWRMEEKNLYGVRRIQAVCARTCALPHICRTAAAGTIALPNALTATAAAAHAEYVRKVRVYALARVTK